MNVLYKYCDTNVVEILKTLKLKLPYISQVNDPLECLPFMYCPDDYVALEEECLSVLKRKKIPVPAGYKQELRNAGIRERLEEGTRESIRAVNRKSCLLSVSKTAQNIVMWAHYAEQQKGAVIGINFNNVHPETNEAPGVKMHSVSYSKKRPKINILDRPKGNVPQEAILKAVMTKSDSWEYEKEFRSIFLVDYLKELQHKKNGTP